MPPLVSVIIVNFDGEEFLRETLLALRNQTFRDFEVIIVDNGSTDGSADDLERRWSTLNLRVERLPNNVGFAAANNIGAMLARGEWLALLNPDAFPRPDWLELLVNTAIAHPEFVSFASCLLQAKAPMLLDGAGDMYHVSGLAWRRHHGEPISAIENKSEEIFSACAATALYRRDAFLAVGGFDEFFFCYHEDVDLGFRLRLQGYRCLYVPEAVVYHVGAGSSVNNPSLRIYWGHRNLVWTYTKNMPGLLFWLCLPIHLVMTVAYLIYFTSHGHGRAICRAKIDAVRGLGHALRSRSRIQRGRRVGALKILQSMDHGWSSVVHRIITAER
jgi:GT2 family glycosyltransferase